MWNGWAVTSSYMVGREKRSGDSPYDGSEWSAGDGIVGVLLSMSPDSSSMAIWFPTTSQSELDDSSWQSTRFQRAWVASGCTTVLISLVKSTKGASHSHTWLETCLAGLVAYEITDLASRIYQLGHRQQQQRQNPDLLFPNTSFSRSPQVAVELKQTSLC
ncbi:hypothetical protein RJ639_039429 [Escallonia herrerae]|uniref:Uncharacterized protein n=1 Tax=Escallonia herrerae TaxID=1293975 RepID=A0AA89B803_9ASTE|nr:hypothetical protein RJ639_039429 [Escallonia herrerae]